MRTSADVVVHRTGDRALVIATGDIDLAVDSKVAEALEQLRGCHDVVIDVSGVSFMGSTGVHLLSAAANQAAVTVRGATPPVLRLLDLVGLTTCDRATHAARDSDGKLHPGDLRLSCGRCATNPDGAP